MSEDHEAQDKLIREIVDRCAGQIREHVDCVQIMVNTHREDGSATMFYEKGLGNFYGRQGQVQEWLTIQTQYQKNFAIRKDGEKEE